MAALTGWLASVGPARSTGGLRLLDVSAVDAHPPAEAMPPTAVLDPGRHSAAIRWYAVLARLDAIRERAWRSGSAGLLTQVYAAGSPELELDQANLRAYLDRGLRVDGVSLDVRRLTVVDRHRHRVRLRIVDQLGPLEATTSDGRARSLPRDRPTCHLIDLRHDGNWRVARIVTVRPGQG
ncbi:MAG: hypothetical protein M3445_01610 [Actinomycetota bacterium]|nr:hypothetical protein [Actinomycetota bacterium]